MRKIFILLAITLLISCENNNDDLNGLAGSWEWIATYGGWGNAYYTPENTGNNEKLLISPDYTFVEYHNDTVIRDCSFIIEDMEPDSRKQKIVFDCGLLNIKYEILSSDTLILTDFMTDSYTHLYLKIK